MDSMSTTDSPQPEMPEATAAPNLGQPLTPEMAGLPVADWDYQQPKRGQIRPGVILAIGEQEIIVGLDAKRDGVVPFADMLRMGPEALAQLSVGDRVEVYVLHPEDQDGNLVVSLFQARQAQAWQQAEELEKSGKIWDGQVVGYNKGGLVVPVGDIRGFVPASQIPGFPQGLSQEERLHRLSSMVGQTTRVKVIELNRRNRRLILSALAADRELREQQREQLLEQLREGEVRSGTISSLCSFGAFVDLGGAEGLVHLSELSWRRVRHPREVVNVGDQVEVYVLRLDEENKRIGLSLKRLEPEPWARVEDRYELGQLVEGVVTNVVDFGAFAQIDEGVEGLIHISELTEQPISHPREMVRKGDLLCLRIIRIDLRRKRLGLSLKRVLDGEWTDWAARQPMVAGRPRPVPQPPQPKAEPVAAAPEAEEDVREPAEPLAEEQLQEAEPVPVAVEEVAGPAEPLAEEQPQEAEPEPVAGEEIAEPAEPSADEQLPEAEPQPVASEEIAEPAEPSAEEQPQEAEPVPIAAEEIPEAEDSPDLEQASDQAGAMVEEAD